jgi:hypothetical protein
MARATGPATFRLFKRQMSQRSRRKAMLAGNDLSRNRQYEIAV